MTLGQSTNDIHLLYEPNAPDYRTDTPQSLFDRLAPETSLSTFLDVLTQVEELFPMFNSTYTPPFTVFCPVNSAFTHTYSRDRFKDFLRQHIVPSEKLKSSSLQHSQQLETLLPDHPLYLHHHLFTGKVEINGKAIVDLVPIEAVNGIAYRIDHILMDSSLLTAEY
ncbi:FAS1 domain-containing protein [Spinellus fusiger]|nr:FAS1 domain-containing protein [Spinellus fusiger]